MLSDFRSPRFPPGCVNSLLFGAQALCVGMIAQNPKDPKLSEVMKAAVLSGAMISVVVTPMEGVKARLQVQYHSGADACSVIRLISMKA